METALKLLGLLFLLILYVVIGTVVIVLFWQWVIPDIFPGAVSQGLLPASLTFLQAFKLSLFLGILGLKGSSSSSKK